MDRLAQIKTMLATGNKESQAELAPIISCFSDVMKARSEIAADLDTNLPRLPAEAQKLWAGVLAELRQ